MWSKRQEKADIPCYMVILVVQIFHNSQSILVRSTENQLYKKKIDSKWDQKKYRDKHAKTLSTLRQGQKVKIQDLGLGKNYKKFAHQGTIVKQDEKLDDVYWVKLDKNAGVVKRNRVHLRLVHKPLKCVRFLSNKK